MIGQSPQNVTTPVVSTAYCGLELIERPLVILEALVLKSHAVGNIPHGEEKPTGSAFIRSAKTANSTKGGCVLHGEAIIRSAHFLFLLLQSLLHNAQCLLIVALKPVRETEVDPWQGKRGSFDFFQTLINLNGCLVESNGNVIFVIRHKVVTDLIISVGKQFVAVPKLRLETLSENQHFCVQIETFTFPVRDLRNGTQRVVDLAEEVGKVVPTNGSSVVFQCLPDLSRLFGERFGILVITTFVHTPADCLSVKDPHPG